MWLKCFDSTIGKVNISPRHAQAHDTFRLKHLSGNLPRSCPVGRYTLFPEGLAHQNGCGCHVLDRPLRAPPEPRLRSKCACAVLGGIESATERNEDGQHELGHASDTEAENYPRSRIPAGWGGREGGRNWVILGPRVLQLASNMRLCLQTATHGLEYCDYIAS